MPQKLKKEERAQLSFASVPESVKTNLANDGRSRSLGMNESLYRCMRTAALIHQTTTKWMEDGVNSPVA